jgi:hypothetical protein
MITQFGRRIRHPVDVWECRELWDLVHRCETPLHRAVRPGWQRPREETARTRMTVRTQT